MADYFQATIRFLHILFGIFWIGAILYQHVLLATWRRLPPQVAGPAALAVGKRGIPAALGAGLLTVFFGIWNQYLIYGKVAFQGGVAPVALGFSVFASLAILGLGIAVQIPALRQMEAIAARGPPPAGAPPGPPAELVAIQKRMRMTLMVVTVLALAIVFAMVVATLARTNGW